jgi:two-component system, NarL family, invasion response regulator UvrY
MSEALAPRFLLVDDHALIRRGLRELLVDELPGALFGEAASGPEAIEQVRKSRYDLVILDLSLPGRDGLDVLKEMLVSVPGQLVLVLSVRAEEQYATRALRAGAMGYVTKETAPEELSKAVRKVLGGGKYVSSLLAERLATNLLSPVGPLHESLSDRELQVLCRLGAGKSVKEIGAGLALSEKTISTYRTRILEKMQMKTNAELVRYTLQAGLVE